jgi:cytochrome c peroxidase
MGAAGRDGTCGGGRGRHVPACGAWMLAAVVVAGCGSSGSSEWVWDLPEGLPPPVVPEDNPMTEEKVELGRHLFYDRRLSLNETQACADCHQQDRAFSDGMLTAEGSTGDVHPRNSMQLTNVAYGATFIWAHPDLMTLEEQARGPIFATEPIVEMGFAGQEDELLRRLRNEPVYQDLFNGAFPEDADPYTVDNVLRALASFERTFLSFRAPFDRLLGGDESAVEDPDSVIRGWQLTDTERFDCFHCHETPFFTDSLRMEGQEVDARPFHNIGLYNIDGRGQYPPDNTGLYAHTGEPDDMGRFKAPTLRNVEVTAPFMHDGSYATLEEVIQHYIDAGRNVTDGEWVGDGRDSPVKSEFLTGIPEVTDQERADVMAFLRSLTDQEFLTNPALSNPWE